jgi:hypothetical protein
MAQRQITPISLLPGTPWGKNVFNYVSHYALHSLSFCRFFPRAFYLKIVFGKRSTREGGEDRHGVYFGCFAVLFIYSVLRTKCFLQG